jgi:ArsR family transcriptional regulator
VDAPTTTPLEGTAEVLRTLGDPTRLAIAAMLAREPAALCVCHIEARFALSQPTISHHLKALRAAKLVTTERRGTWIHYTLDRARVAGVPGLAALLAAVEPPCAPDAEACCP